MRRADRLFAIIQALRGGRLRTAGWLAERLEVSRRTIYRDIADLQAHGTPIEGERGIGYILRNDYFMPPLALSAAEQEALRWGAALAVAHGDEVLAGAAREAMVKLGVRPAGVPFFFSGQDGQAKGAALREAREAIAKSLRLQITYHDAGSAESIRTLRPLSLEHWGRIWTLTGWCETRQDFRVFRVDRIQACRSGAYFKPEEGKRLEDYLYILSQQKLAQQDSAVCETQFSLKCNLKDYGEYPAQD